MKKKFSLTKSEYEVMKILWDNNKPMLKLEILELANNHKWNDNYLKKMLTVLFKKGALESVGVQRVGKVNSRMYVPTMTEDEYNVSQYPVFNTATISNLVCNLYETSDAEKKSDLVNELEVLLNKFKDQ